MCGLIAAINKKGKNVNEEVIDMFENQYSRGMKGFGVIIKDKKDKIKIERATESTKFMFDMHILKSNFMLVHHRTPTSTENRISQTHPIVIDNKKLKYKYYAMHNGVIRNDDELKEKHEKFGFKYTTEETEYWSTGYVKERKVFNDSEAILTEVALYIENKIEEIDLDGSAAFMLLQVDKKTNKMINFFYGRHNNPLNIQKQNGLITIASEGPGIEIEKDILFNIKPNSIKIHQKIMKFKEEPIPVKIETKIEPKASIDTNQKALWTKEDEEEMNDYNSSFYQGGYGNYLRHNYETGTPFTLEEVIEGFSGDISSCIEDFIMELQDEDLAYKTDIGEKLEEIKGIMKEMKGVVISEYREKDKEKKEKTAEFEQAMGFKKKALDYNDKLVELPIF